MANQSNEKACAKTCDTTSRNSSADKVGKHQMLVPMGNPGEGFTIQNEHFRIRSVPVTNQGTIKLSLKGKFIQVRARKEIVALLRQQLPGLERVGGKFGLWKSEDNAAILRTYCRFFGNVTLDSKVTKLANNADPRLHKPHYVLMKRCHITEYVTGEDGEFVERPPAHQVSKRRHKSQKGTT
ncbi:MAG: hypothetical protein ACPGXK_06890 [Phycisphaerae bacterium]